MWEILVRIPAAFPEEYRCSMLPIPQHRFTHFPSSSAIQEGSGFKYEMKLCRFTWCFFVFVSFLQAVGDECG